MRLFNAQEIITNFAIGSISILPTIIHFHLLKTRLPAWTFTIPLLIFYILYPLYLIDRNTDGFEIALIFPVLFACRVFDASQHQRSQSRRWSFREYLEFTLTFHTLESRKALLQVEHQRFGNNVGVSRESRMVGQDRQTYVYYTCLVIKKSVLMFICNVLVQHIQHIRPKWAPEAYRLASLSEPVLMMHYLFLGTTMIACVDIGMDIFSHVVATVFKTGVVPAMDAPWCSASVGEFWGKRWNYVIQLNLKRCGYTPFLNMFAPSVPQSKGLKGGGNGHSQGTVHKGYIILATLYTFLLSAAIHEWIIYISCDAQHTGEQALFFVAHGVICIMEGLAGNLFPAVRVPKILRIAYCFVVMGCTAPLFFNPMIRDGSYYRYTIWIA